MLEIEPVLRRFQAGGKVFILVGGAQHSRRCKRTVACCLSVGFYGDTEAGWVRNTVLPGVSAN